MRLLSALALSAFVSLVACGGGSSKAEAPDAPDASVVADAGDAAADGDAGAPAPEGTALVATFNGETRPLTRAQFGTTARTDTLHVEAHEGGSAACPDEGSPTPDRTFVVSSVPRDAAAGSVVSEADGVTAGFFDFVGEQLQGKPVASATAVRVTIVSIEDATVRLEVEATFEQGTVRGRIDASLCASLSE